MNIQHLRGEPGIWEWEWKWKWKLEQQWIRYEQDGDWTRYMTLMHTQRKKERPTHTEKERGSNCTSDSPTYSVLYMHQCVHEYLLLARKVNLVPQLSGKAVDAKAVAKITWRCWGAT